MAEWYVSDFVANSDSRKLLATIIIGIIAGVYLINQILPAPTKVGLCLHCTNNAEHLDWQGQAIVGRIVSESFYTPGSNWDLHFECRSSFEYTYRRSRKRTFTRRTVLLVEPTAVSCGKEMNLLYIVKSRPEDKSQRDAVRIHYNSSTYEGYSVVIVFPFNGLSSAQIHELKLENDVNGDILIGNGKYFWNSSNIISAFHWAKTKCFDFVFVLRSDYYFGLIHLLPYINSSKESIYGGINCAYNLPVPYQDGANLRQFPCSFDSFYCHSEVYFMNFKLMQIVEDFSWKAEIFPTADDRYVGFCLEQAAIPFKIISLLQPWPPTINQSNFIFIA